MKKAEYSEISVDDHVDFENFPHIDYDGRRFVKELEFQIFDNPNWTNAERQFWNYMRNRFLSCTFSYEQAIAEAYMAGAEYGNTLSGLDESA